MMALADTQPRKNVLLYGANGEPIDSNASGQVAVQDPPNLDASLATVAAALDLDLNSIDAVLKAIRDTAGVKKITDQLPAGVNNIGAVDAWTHDGAGNEIASVVVETIRRLEQRGVITSPDGTKNVDVILDKKNDNVNRLQTEALTAPGSKVNIATGIPADPSDLIIAFCENGGSEDMLVNGAPTTFEFGPTGTDVYVLEELLFVFCANDLKFDGASFGPNTALTTGIEVKLAINSVTTTLLTIQRNEDFLRLPGRLPLVNNAGPKDVLDATISFGGLTKLDGATSDKVQVTINDNLTSKKLKYLTATVFSDMES